MTKSCLRARAGDYHRFRLSGWAIPAAALLLAVLAGLAVTGLVARANSDREAQLTLQTVQTQVNTIQGEPYASGQLATDAVVKASIRRDEAAIERELAGLQHPASNPVLSSVEGPLHENFAVLERLRQLVSGGKPQVAYVLDPEARQSLAIVSRGLRLAGTDYQRRARAALSETTAGSIAAIALLLVAFLFFYVSATRSRAALARLLARSQDEALTDALTGLGNRRAFYEALGSIGPLATESDPLAVILFDLDGFKAYNDGFGHVAGDVLLARLGERLSRTVDDTASAFRVGGDEFCVLARARPEKAESVARFAAAALSEEAEGLRIGCSYGLALVPADGTDAEHVLRLADQRMYRQKRDGAARRRRGAA